MEQVCSWCADVRVAREGSRTYSAQRDSVRPDGSSESWDSARLEYRATMPLSFLVFAVHETRSLPIIYHQNKLWNIVDVLSRRLPTQLSFCQVSSVLLFLEGSSGLLFLEGLHQAAHMSIAALQGKRACWLGAYWFAFRRQFNRLPVVCLKR